MWEVVSLFAAMAVLMLLLNYFMEPKQLIKDIQALKGSNSKVAQLEQRVETLEKLVKTLSEK
jgi:hypothetical protein